MLRTIVFVKIVLFSFCSQLKHTVVGYGVLCKSGSHFCHSNICFQSAIFAFNISIMHQQTRQVPIIQIVTKEYKLGRHLLRH